MTIKTFNPNRVGGGTFELEQDPTTGEYKLKEVGFIKLPELKLPEIDQADPIIPPDDDDDTDDDTGGGTGGGGSSGGRDDTDRPFDFTGSAQLKNIQEEATQFSKRIQTMVENQEAQERAAGISAEGTPLTTSKFLASGAAGGARLPEVNENLIDRGNPTGDSRIVSEEQGLVGNRVPDRIMERTSQFGALAMPQTTTQFGVPDAVKFGQPSLPDPVSEPKKNILQVAGEKAKKIIDNSLPVKALVGIGRGLQAIEDSLLGPQQVALNKINKSTLTSLGYTTRGALGSSTDVGRVVAFDPETGRQLTAADNVFVGSNMTSGRGDIFTSSANRIKTRNSAKTQARISKLPPARQEAFNNKTKEFERQRQDALDKKEREQAKINQETMNQGPAGQADGGSSGGGKSIVCTAMYQTTGLQDWAKAMKIWYIYQKRYLTIQHQEGYHKLFKPFVKGMHKSNIIKAIGAHFAKHRTQHLKHVMFNSKPSLLGKIYNKVLEPICYWAGRK